MLYYVWKKKVEVITMGKASEAQLRAQTKYEKKNVSQVILQDLEREKKEANNK